MEKNSFFASNNNNKQDQTFLLTITEIENLAKAGDSNAQYLLGRSLWTGWYDCVIDKEAGEKWIAEALKSEKTPAGLCAQGFCYEFAICGVSVKNFEKALACFQEAATQSYIPAMYELAYIFYHQGQTVTRSSGTYDNATHTHVDRGTFSDVIRLLTHCAEQKYPPAYLLLGLCYYNAYGVSENRTEAVRLWQMGSDAGVVDARRLLGGAYTIGEGVKSDLSKAKSLIKDAQKHGFNVRDEKQNLKVKYSQKNGGCLIL